MHITTLHEQRRAAAADYDALRRQKDLAPADADRLIGLDALIDCLSGEIFRRESNRG